MKPPLRIRWRHPTLHQLSVVDENGLVVAIMPMTENKLAIRIVNTFGRLSLWQLLFQRNHRQEEYDRWVWESNRRPYQSDWRNPGRSDWKR